MPLGLLIYRKHGLALFGDSVRVSNACKLSVLAEGLRRPVAVKKGALPSVVDRFEDLSHSW